MIPVAMLMRPTVILTVALALAVGGCATFAGLYKGQLKKVGAVEAQRAQAQAAATQCSDGVKRLREADAERQREVSRAAAMADREHKRAQERALETLQTPPTVVAAPGAAATDVRAAACESVEQFLASKFSERRAKGDVK